MERAATTLPHGYLTKPFEDTEIQNAIEMAINKQNEPK